MPTNIKWILKLLAAVIIFSMAVVKIGDYDFWYHLRAGQLILETGAIRHLEPFSFAAGDVPWSVQSWLAGVILYVVYSASGLSGVIIFNALLVSLVFLLVYMTIRLTEEEGSSIALALVIIVIAAFAVRFRIFVRPHIFEFVFLATLLYILNLYRIKGVNRLYIIPVIQILWVNIHGSHILGLMLPVIFLAGAQLSSRFGGRTDSEGAGSPDLKALTRAMVILFCVNILVTLINPETYRALIFPFLITGQKTYMQNIGEWQPLNLTYLWGYGLRYTWGFSLLVILAVIGIVKSRRSVDLTGVLLLVIFFVMALKGIRLMAEFAIACAPVVYWNLVRSGGKEEKKKERILPGAVAVLLLVLVALPLVFISKTYSRGLGVKENIFPERAVDFIESEGIKGNVFNSFGFGDYLAWRSFPEKKVLIHGRNEVFTQEFYQEYLDAHTDPEVWKSLADRFDITHTLLEYYLTDYEGKEMVPHLAGNPEEWVPVYWDRLAVVYVRNIPANREVIKKWGFIHIFPSYLDFTYLDEEIRRRGEWDTLSEFERLLRSSPDNEEAYLARAYLYFRMGRRYYKNATEDLTSAIRIKPDRAMTHSAMGMLQQRTGNAIEARASYERALQLDPTYPGALQGLEGLKE